MSVRSEDELLAQEKIFLEYKHESVPVNLFPGWKSEDFTNEHRKNMSIAASKRTRTKEHIEKLHEGRRNSKNSPEHAAAVIASRVGSKHTDEAKQKMSEKRKLNSNKYLISSKAGKASAEKRSLDPNYKKQQSEKMKAIWAKRKGGMVNGD